jgi:hypothetical protein
MKTQANGAVPGGKGRKTAEKLPTPAVPDPSPSATVADGRDGKSGKFLAGNTFSRGNPHWRRRCELMKAIHKAIGEREIKRLFRGLLDMALDCDLEAAKLLLGYAVGPPPAEPIDPDDEDADEVRRLRDRPGVEGADGVLRLLRSRSLGVLIAAVARIDEARAAGREGDPVGQLLNDVAFRKQPDDDEEGDGEQEHD